MGESSARPPKPGPLLASSIQAAKDAEAAGDQRRAFACLQLAEAQLKALRAPDAAWVRSVRQGLWRLSPLWWSDVSHGGISLRRCRRGDADFYRACFADAAFRSQFNRQQAWKGDLANALDNAGKDVPARSSLLMWVVQTSAGNPLGLASLSSIDTVNRKTEFAVGFPGAVPPVYGIKATMLVLHFAMKLMHFNKVYSYVYEDNPKALHNAVRLGFVHEGLLRDHFLLPEVGFMSVNVVALTAAQLQASSQLRALAQRLIGQDW